VIDQRIQCAITNAHSSAMHAAAVWIELAPHLGHSVTINLLLFEWLSAAVVDSVSLRPSPLLTHYQAASVAAGQQHSGQ